MKCLHKKDLEIIVNYGVTEYVHLDMTPCSHYNNFTTTTDQMLSLQYTSLTDGGIVSEVAFLASKYVRNRVYTSLSKISNLDQLQSALVTVLKVLSQSSLKEPILMEMLGTFHATLRHNLAVMGYAPESLIAETYGLMTLPMRRLNGETSDLDHELNLTRKNRY